MTEIQEKLSTTTLVPTSHQGAFASLESWRNATTWMKHPKLAKQWELSSLPVFVSVDRGSAFFDKYHVHIRGSQAIWTVINRLDIWNAIDSLFDAAEPAVTGFELEDFRTQLATPVDEFCSRYDVWWDVSADSSTNDALFDSIRCKMVWDISANSSSTGDTFVDFIRDTFEQDPFAGYKEYQSADWDAFGAQPISAETVEAARSILRWLPREWNRPEIAPSADGSIGFEWDRTEGPISTLFIDVGPGRVWRAYWRKANDEKGHRPKQALDENTKNTLADMFRQMTE